MASTFHGGIYPRGRKHLTEEVEFKNLSIPQFCYIPLKQHIGSPAKPVVVAGSIVREGELIAAADGKVSANIHASIPGKVIEITGSIQGKKKQAAL